jgi:NitT/TauT family transport system substrate-binding protein
MKKYVSVIGALGIAALGVTGCGQKAGAPGAANSGKVELRIGIQPNVSHAVPLVGFSEKYNTYRKEMPDVAFDVKSFNAGPAMMESLKAGALDIALFGPPPIINTWVKTKDFVVIANTAIGGSVLVAKPAGLKTVKDLSGKTIAVPQVGNVQDVFARVLLKQNGLATTEKGGTVTLLAIPTGDILQQMKAGNIEAALVPEPWGSRLEKEAGAHVVLEWNQMPLKGEYPQTMYIASRKWVDAHPDAAKKLVEVTNSLTEQIAKDPDSYADTISAEIKKTSGKDVPAALVRDSFKRVKFSTKVSDDDLSKYADLVVIAGYQKTKPDMAGVVVKP